MIKNANSPPPGWGKIVNKMLAIPTLDPIVREFISSPSKLKWSPPPSDKAEARAFVSTEDVNNDGTIDKINIVMTNINKDIPQNILSKLETLNNNDPILDDLAKSFAEIITHEVAHIKSFDPEKGEFVGGETPAQVAEQQFRASVSALYSLEITRDLLKFASKLDSIGLPHLADEIDKLFVKK